MRRAFLSCVLIAAVVIPLQGIAAERFGRLFFTPAQRSALDAGKQVRTQKIPSAPTMRGPREVTLNGVVTRSDGESTVWVNGSALGNGRNSSVRATTSLSDPAAARVTVSDSQGALRLRVGQRANRNTGKVTEPYEDSTPAHTDKAAHGAQESEASPSKSADLTEARIADADD